MFALGPARHCSPVEPPQVASDGPHWAAGERPEAPAAVDPAGCFASAAPWRRRAKSGARLVLLLFSLAICPIGGQMARRAPKVCPEAAWGQSAQAAGWLAS